MSISVHLILVLLLVGVLNPFLFSWNYEWLKIRLVDVQPGIWWYICHLPKCDFTGYFFCLCKFGTSCMVFLERYFQFYLMVLLDDFHCCCKQCPGPCLVRCPGPCLVRCPGPCLVRCPGPCLVRTAVTWVFPCLHLKVPVSCLVNTAVRCLLPVFCDCCSDLPPSKVQFHLLLFSTSIKWPTSSFWKLYHCRECFEEEKCVCGGGGGGGGGGKAMSLGRLSPSSSWLISTAVTCLLPGSYFVINDVNCHLPISPWQFHFLVL